MRPTEGKLTEEFMSFWTHTLRVQPDEGLSPSFTAVSFVPLTCCGMMVFSYSYEFLNLNKLFSSTQKIELSSA